MRTSEFVKKYITCALFLLPKLSKHKILRIVIKPLMKKIILNFKFFIFFAFNFKRKSRKLANTLAIFTIVFLFWKVSLCKVLIFTDFSIFNAISKSSKSITLEKNQTYVEKNVYSTCAVTNNILNQFPNTCNVFCHLKSLYSEKGNYILLFLP